MNTTRRSTFSNWIFSTFEVTPKGLGLYRIFAGLYILLFLLPSTSIYAFLGEMPPQFYNPPPGPFMLFTGFPPSWLMFVFQAVLILATLSMLIGYHTRISSLLVGLMFFFLKGFMFGLGKIDHEILLIVVPVLMAFSGWGARYSVDENRSRSKTGEQPWVFALLALLIGFMFFTAGFPKILGGWFDLSTQATEGHFYKQFFVRQRQDLLAPYALNMSGILWEFLDYTTIIFEVGFIAAILRSSTTRVFLCIAVLFHFSIMMIMNIPFLPNFLAYAAFFNWAWFDDIINRKIPFTKTSYGAPVVLIAVMLCAYILANISQSFFMLESDLTHAAVILVSSFAAIAFISLIRELLKILRGNE